MTPFVAVALHRFALLHARTIMKYLVPTTNLSPERVPLWVLFPA